MNMVTIEFNSVTKIDKPVLRIKSHCYTAENNSATKIPY